MPKNDRTAHAAITAKAQVDHDLRAMMHRHLDVEALLAAGAIEGPARKTKPIKLGFFRIVLNRIRGQK